MSELEKCPLCGGDASVGPAWMGNFGVTCNICEHTAPLMCTTPKAAADHWNDHARNSQAAKLKTEYNRLRVELDTRILDHAKKQKALEDRLTVETARLTAELAACQSRLSVGQKQFDEMQADINGLHDRLATANETIRRNERSAAYQYEQYNEVKRENAALRAELDWTKAERGTQLHIIEASNSAMSVYANHIEQVRAELEAAREWAALWKRSAKKNHYAMQDIEIRFANFRIMVKQAGYYLP